MRGIADVRSARGFCRRLRGAAIGVCALLGLLSSTVWETAKLLGPLEVALVSLLRDVNLSGGECRLLEASIVGCEGCCQGGCSMRLCARLNATCRLVAVNVVEGAVVVPALLYGVLCTAVPSWSL